MRPEERSETLLAMTRSKAKMFEYDVPASEHIKILQDPSKLFTLSIGLLGDLAAHSDPENGDAARITELRESLQFSARFFDSYMQAQFNRNLDPYLMLLGAASFYLCELPGSSVVLARSIGPKSEDLGGQGLEELLRWILQGDFSQGIAWREGIFTEPIDRIAALLRQFFIDGRSGDDLLAECDRLKQIAYDFGTPRQLLLADVVRSVVKKKHRNSAWHALPEYTDLPEAQWMDALKKDGFIRELWPAQHLLGSSGVLRGSSAVVQMPTSAGKTRATELIIRSAFLSGRTSLAVIVAPFRALCHEIRNSLTFAFRNEPVRIDELSDVLQGDFEITELLSRNQVLVVTPEKFVYVLRHTPEIASNIGLIIFDEGHQFDSGTRGITYELLLTSLKTMLPDEVQKVLISAVISNAPALAEWLNGPGSEVVTGTKLIPTYRTVGFASWTDQRGKLEFVANNDAEKEEFYVPRVVEELALQRRGREKKARVFPERSGQDVGLLLGLKLVKNGAVAIFCGRKATAANVCERAVEIFDRRVPLIAPSVYSDAVETKKLHRLHLQNLGADATATRSAEIGVFSHHGNTPHGIRLAVEHAMRLGLARFVVCTSTLAQGVNLPIRYLLVTSVYQGQERIKVRDFHNLIGRAGRAGMHTEGSILFADPQIYDKRKNAYENWRWNQVKELLEPANSEPCISSLLSFFDPLTSDNERFKLTLDAMDFVKGYIDDPAALAKLAEEGAAKYADQGFTKQGLEVQIRRKIEIIWAIESFLLAHWDAGVAPLETDDVVRLARGTLAYFLADDNTKRLIENLFSTVANNLAKQVDDADRRKVYGKTLYGAMTSQEIEEWVATHVEELIASSSTEEILDLLWPLISAHVQNGTFRKCDKPDALKELARAWIAGQPFNVILQALRQQEARLIWGEKFRELTIEHVVDMCEGGLAFDGSLLVGAIIELAGYVAPDAANDLTEKLQRFQKTVKYGLPTSGMIALYELGFADRVVAAALSTSLGLLDEQQRDAFEKIKQERHTVAAILENYPSYFTHMMNDVL